MRANQNEQNVLFTDLVNYEGNTELELHIFT